MTITRRHTVYVLLAALLAIILWSYIDAKERVTWWMEALPVFIAAPLLYFTHKKFPLTPLLYLAIWFHAVVLLVGAHYTYAEMPLFDWFREIFNFERNHYDRFGHVMQGAVPALAARELLLRTSPLKSGKWLFTIIVLSCTGISAIYELIEWAAAEIQGDAADSFLGAQGDIWDSQKDMFLAMLGAALSLLAFGKLQDKQIKKLKA